MELIKDSECNKNTPIKYGHPEEKIYVRGKAIKPLYPSKQSSEYDKKIYLKELLPLEKYDLIIVLFSGGKDSIAAYYRMLEMGVPKEKLELWHHDIDGEHPTRRMDWPVTQAYIRAFAEAEGVRLRASWREQGFYGELYRVGASHPIRYEDNGEIKYGPISQAQLESAWIRNAHPEAVTPEAEELLKIYGHRMKFPAKSGDLSRRWCSAYLKICVADTVIRHLEKTRSNTKILVVSGERRGESAGRSKYNEMEKHRVNATAKAMRSVHQWRAVIDYSLRDVWEVLRRHKVTPHPCYNIG